MAQHVRYANADANDRAIVRFTRTDLLLRGEINGIKMPRPVGHLLVGPTILDALLRSPLSNRKKPAVWTLRDPLQFIELPDKRDASAGHPFKPSLVSGGFALSEDNEFVQVQKASTVSIGAVAYRLAVGMHGTVGAAYKAIAAKAVAAWAADLVRSRRLYEAIKAAPKGELLETPDIAALRPVGSISEQIERDILREACVWLGVDPDMEIKRPRGRPRKSDAGDTESGDFISVTVTDGVLSAKTIAAIASVAPGVDLASLSVIKLVAMLDLLRQNDAQHDAELLEAFLDASAPDWRDANGDTGGVSSATPDDPYTVLGVERGMSLEEITQRYRRIMQSVHPDRGACPPWLAQSISGAYRQIKDELGGAS